MKALDNKLYVKFMQLEIGLFRNKKNTFHLHFHPISTGEGGFNPPICFLFFPKI